MSERTVSWVMIGIGTAWIALILVMVIHALRYESELPNGPARPRRGDRIKGLVRGIMSALDDALARLTTFVKDVVTQLKAAQSTNDTQTGKLVELQAALDAALSDDAADKAAINALQAEIAGLQDSVAAQINAAVDALQNPLPVLDPVEPPVTPDITVPPLEVPATDTGDAPVE